MLANARLVALQEEIEVTLAARPHKFSVDCLASEIVLRGEFYLYDERGRYDEYHLEISFPEKFPQREPRVREIAGRIPQTAERHNSASCCICVWEFWLADEPQNSVANFFDGPLKRYFIAQTVYEVKRCWIFGEEQHYAEGLLDAYARALNVMPDKMVVGRYLRLLSRGPLKKRWACPCSSGKKISQCHSVEMENLSKRIEPKLAKRMLRRLERMSRK